MTSWGLIAAATALLVAAIQLGLWSIWTYRGLPSPWADVEAYRAAQHTATGRMLLALLSATAGLALIGQWLAVGITAFMVLVMAWLWGSSHPARYAGYDRDRPPGGRG